MNIHYTTHGHGFPAPDGMASHPPPHAVARCSGPAGCDVCSSQAGWGVGRGFNGAYLPASESQIEALHAGDVR